jgi:hypothetical protein
MYLIHSFMMRSLLAWVVYGLIPDSTGLVGRVSDYEEDRVPKSILWSMVTAITMASWLALVMYLSVLWRDRLDPLFGTAAQWVENVMLGKKSLLEGFAIRYNGVQLTLNGNSDEKRVWREKNDPELGVKA